MVYGTIIGGGFQGCFFIDVSSVSCIILFQQEIRKNVDNIDRISVVSFIFIGVYCIFYFNSESLLQSTLERG